jgi:hypothetical protein
LIFSPRLYWISPRWPPEPTVSESFPTLQKGQATYGWKILTQMIRFSSLSLSLRSDLQSRLGITGWLYSSYSRYQGRNHCA